MALAMLENILACPVAEERARAVSIPAGVQIAWQRRPKAEWQESVPACREL